MNFQLPLLPLKELCLIKTAICLCSTEKLHDFIIKKCIRHSGRRSLIWDCLRDHVFQLPLPITLIEELQKQLTLIVLELEMWMRDNLPLPRESRTLVQACLDRRTGPYCRQLFCSKAQKYFKDLTLDRYYLRRLSWNYRGVIERRQMAQMIVKDNRVEDRVRQKQAERFYFMVDAYDLFRKRKTQPDLNFVQYIESFKGGFYDDGKFAVNYFWYSSSSEEKQKLIDHFIKDSFGLVAAETTRFVLNRLSLSEQLKCLEEGAYIRLLEWPNYNLFLKLTEDHLELISPKALYSALDYLWISAKLRNHELHDKVLTSFVPLLPERVVLLYAAVKETMILFMNGQPTEIEKYFQTISEEDVEVDLESACDILKNYPKYDYESGTREIRARLRRYYKLSTLKISSLKKDVQICFETLFKEYVKRAKVCYAGFQQANRVQRCDLTICNYLKLLEQ